MRRKPWLAGLLSFVVPGLGQFYAGRMEQEGDIDSECPWMV
jgi:hypothetical protein